ncbi:hypothetical protein GR160_15625 [Flavobacterium sp. Sd200]|uniref:pentapeptide repeat-containing protein n=1 Tax=Flavobacterium sp. Sd200 TaxID=2692211 RepID=UPI0013710F8A|nr:hypothetical protein [Flavobacterium sp. Sd200]MXN92658.1 hypothetical protein [Flavobacterium sp. Sd200]
MVYQQIEILINHIQTYGVINNSIIDIPEIELKRLTKDISFINCKFKVVILHITDNENNVSIEFSNCNFFGQIRITNCSLNRLSFSNINSLDGLYIDGNERRKVKISSFVFTNDGKRKENPLDIKIQIENCDFESFDFFNINHIGPYFIFKNNILGTKEPKKSYRSQSFQNLWITNAVFENNLFNEKTYFFRSVFIPKSKYFTVTFYNVNVFSENVFSEVNFENVNFYEYANFNQCDFKGAVSFYNMNNYHIGDLSFYECNFSERANFEYARVKNLNFKLSKFEQNVSFSNTSVDTFILHRNILNKITYFDGLEIKDIRKCDRISLRTIKQELQKTDNKIDYNRFRAYEMEAYYRELKWNWKDGKDKFILGSTWLVTGFDHSWRRALFFTLVNGWLFYSLFFISENYMLIPDLSEWKTFCSGYFRFLLVTDFYNPLATGRDYIDNTNTIGWLIFILGKIVIAFGIYEMIQAFRKFKP